MSVENHYGMEVGSVVEVPMADGVPRYGVIRWMGSEGKAGSRSRIGE